MGPSKGWIVPPLTALPPDYMTAEPPDSTCRRGRRGDWPGGAAARGGVRGRAEAHHRRRGDALLGRVGDGGQQRRRARRPGGTAPPCCGAGTRNEVTWSRTSAIVAAWAPLPDPPRARAAPPPTGFAGCQGVEIPIPSRTDRRRASPSASRHPGRRHRRRRCRRGLIRRRAATPGRPSRPADRLPRRPFHRLAGRSRRHRAALHEPRGAGQLSTPPIACTLADWPRVDVAEMARAAAPMGVTVERCSSICSSLSATGT